MSEVKRWNVESDEQDGPCSLWNVESAEGEFIKYEDYAALKEQFNFKQNLTEQVVALQKQRDALAAELIPEGYALVPQQMHLSADAMESLCFHCGDGGFAFGDFTDGLLWVGDIENDDGTKTYGLNIATAEYPEEGSANVSEFAAQLRAGEPS